ncbi:hypothetical protein H4R34_000277 [Dimargaris verticillata]|uniref:PX domain-containing protein n=1 Tax=Dimargaris verticillata TaxID=2761393 RepID=A0A9W8EEU7_9FUNG|nr:hypothetical protein H4R34_000277 [Dimargaris verticillata]
MITYEQIQTALNVVYEFSVALQGITNNVIARKAKRVEQPSSQGLAEVSELQADIQDLSMCVAVLKQRAVLCDRTAELAKLQHRCFNGTKSSSSEQNELKSQLALEKHASMLFETIRREIISTVALVPPHEQLSQFKSFVASPITRHFLQALEPPPNAKPPLQIHSTLHSTLHTTTAPPTLSHAEVPLSAETDLDGSMYHSVYESTPSLTLPQTTPGHPGRQSPLMASLDADALMANARRRLSSLNLAHNAAEPVEASHRGQQSPHALTASMHRARSGDGVPAKDGQLLWSQNELNQNYLGAARSSLGPHLTRHSLESSLGRVTRQPAPANRSRMSTSQLPSERAYASSRPWRTPPTIDELASSTVPTLSASQHRGYEETLASGTHHGENDRATSLSTCSSDGEYTEVDDAESAAVPLFATEVTVTDPIRVGFSLNSYVVYKCRAQRPDGTEVAVHRRYTDFENLRRALARAYRPFRRGIPKMPEKKVVGNFDREFLEHRQHELQYLLSYLVLHPVIGTSPLIPRWFESSRMS